MSAAIRKSAPHCEPGETVATPCISSSAVTIAKFEGLKKCRSPLRRKYLDAIPQRGRKAGKEAPGVGETAAGRAGEGAPWDEQNG